MKENLHWIILLAGLLIVVASSLVAKFKAKRRIKLMPTLGDMDTFKEVNEGKSFNSGFGVPKNKGEEVQVIPPEEVLRYAQGTTPGFSGSESKLPSSARKAHGRPNHQPTVTNNPYNTLAAQSPDYIVIGVMAKPGESFVGYDLLQALLTAKLRFGSNQIFHAHEYPHGQGEILYSVASHGDPGTFDIHNMGACVTRGLIVFMDLNRFEQPRKILYKMLDGAHKLSEDLEGVVVDHQKRPLTQETLKEILARVEACENEGEPALI